MAPKLERIRLEHRAARLQSVLRELRARAGHHPAPHLIGRAIESFDAELAAVRRQLADGSRAARERRDPEPG